MVYVMFLLFIWECMDLTKEAQIHLNKEINMSCFLATKKSVFKSSWIMFIKLYLWVSDCYSLGYIVHINELYSIYFSCSLDNFTAHIPKLKKLKILVHKFGCALLRLLVHPCTTLDFFLKSGFILCTLNQPSLFTKDVNLLPPGKYDKK